MRVAVVDMGTNSTRLLVAEVEGGRIALALERQSRVTRLGRGVDSSGRLADEAIDETCAAIGDYRVRLERLGVDRVVSLATSAVRDASNGDAFLAELRERFALDVRILEGSEEARLTYLGAVADRKPADGTLVIDIGGGSTELIVGRGADLRAHASLQLGVVRHSERHLHSNPPAAAELEALAADVRGVIGAEIERWEVAEPSRAGASPRDAEAARGGAAPDGVAIGIAVAGTATSLAAIDLALDPYDPDAVHGHGLSLEAIQRHLSRLAAAPLAERREVTGLHPDRAPTIVAGVVILIQAMRAFDLAEIEVSEHDLLYGAALEATADG